ncbi:MAG: sugar phosphate isomerase/epimerase [Phycisphaerales bacterium]|nr:sugar phosphate isomerase/epimerase [Phycisphaerales bacterium]
MAIRTASAAGFGGILLDAATAHLDLTTLSTTGIREFRHLLSAANVKLTALRAPLDPKGFSHGADIDHQLNILEKILRAAANLHCPLVSLDVGPLPSPPSQPPPPAITPKQAGLILIPDFTPAKSPDAPPAGIAPHFTPQVDGALAELGNRADRYGVPLALHSGLSGFAALIHVIRAVDCPWFGIDLDPVALLPDDWDIDQLFSVAGSLIQHVRARDALLGDRHRTRLVPVGTGNVDWPHLLSNLHHADYRGSITLDPASLADPLAAASAGRSALLKMWPGGSRPS